VSEINDGGPAFPLQVIASPNSEIQHGMSLRDWFAGQALSSIPLRNWNVDEVGADAVAQAWATCAYRVADLMLAEREAKP
jgi:hypothetical protein